MKFSKQKDIRSNELPRGTGRKEEALQERFEHMRDVRFLKDSDVDLRRSSSLYPNYGSSAIAVIKRVKALSFGQSVPRFHTFGKKSAGP